MVKKRTRNIILGVSISIFIAIALIFIFTQDIGQSVLGISQDVNVLGDGDKLIILTSVGNEKDNIIVELTKSQLNDKLEGDGWSVENGARISLDLIKFSEIFPLVKNENEIFFEAKTKDTGNTFLILQSKGTLIKECKTDRGLPETVDAYLIEGGFFRINNLACIFPNEVGVRSQVSGAAILDFNIEVGVGGDTDSITPNNKVARLLGGDVEVSFEGSINAPNEIKQVPFDILWRDGSFRHLISTASQSFIGVSSTRNSIVSCTSNFGNLDSRGHERCLNTYNNDLTRALENKNDDFAPLIVKSINLESQTSNRGALIIEAEPTKYPLIKIIVDGDFLGIERLSGKPDITRCVDDIDTKSGRELTDSISVKNVGSQNGFFLFSSTCNNNNIDVFGSDKNVGEGESENINVRIIGSSDRKGVTEKARCTITIEDRVSGETDSCNFDVSIEFTDVICQPNANLCSADSSKVLSCSSDGDETSIIDSCSSSEVCGLNEDGDIGCIKEGIDITDDVDVGEITDEEKIDVNRLSCEEKGNVFEETSKCGFLCKIGLSDPEESSRCVNPLTEALIVILFWVVGIIIVGGIGFFVFRRFRK